MPGVGRCANRRSGAGVRAPGAQAADIPGAGVAGLRGAEQRADIAGMGELRRGLRTCPISAALPPLAAMLPRAVMLVVCQ
jgi:hypothetical protein